MISPQKYASGMFLRPWESPIRVTKYASVAQLVEQGTENPRVGGSIPPGGTSFFIFLQGIEIQITVIRDILTLLLRKQSKHISYADVAHLVERHLAKVEVASSSLVIRSKSKTHPSGCVFFVDSPNTKIKIAHFLSIGNAQTLYKKKPRLTSFRQRGKAILSTSNH